MKDEVKARTTTCVRTRLHLHSSVCVGILCFSFALLAQIFFSSLLLRKKWKSEMFAGM